MADRDLIEESIGFDFDEVEAEPAHATESAPVEPAPVEPAPAPGTDH